MRDISIVVGGGTPRANDPTNFAEDGFPWVTPADLGATNRMYVFGGRRSLSAKGMNSSAAVMLPRGAVLFSSRAPIGHVAIAGNPVATNQGFRSFLVEDGIVPEFVYFFLRFATPLAESLASGTTFTELSGTNAGHIPILLPPSSEQRRIADKLEAAMAHIEAVERRLSRVSVILTHFRRAVLASAVTGSLTPHRRDLGKSGKTSVRQRNRQPPHASLASDDKDSVAVLPDGWESRIAGDLIVDARYGTSVKSDSKEINGTPVIRVPNIVRGQLDLTDVKYAALSQRERSSLSVRPGDILVCRTNGSLELVGKAAVVPILMREHAFASYVIRLRVNSAQVLPEYLHLCLSSPMGRSYLEYGARTTAGQYNLNLKTLRDLPVPLPSLAEQRDIARRVDALFKLAAKVEKHLAPARSFTETLAAEVFVRGLSGRLTLQNANDEPACLLLARVQELRAHQAGVAKPTRPEGGPRVTRPTVESLKAVIQDMPDDQFSYDDLRAQVAGTYEELKDVVFALLSESEPSLRQIFDRDAKMVRFVRAHG